MTREEIISGLQFTIDMFLFDPNTGETFTEPRNDMDKTTIDACRGAIELLKQEPNKSEIPTNSTPKNNLKIDCNNCKNNFHRGDRTSYCATGDGMCHYECEDG